jgi:hypothetical protein
LHLGDTATNNKTNKRSSNDGGSGDSLVLVGTLRSVPSDYVWFEHEQEPEHGERTVDLDANDPSNLSSGSSSSNMEDFHIVKTLDPNDVCLSVLKDMKAHLLERQRAMDHKISRTREVAEAAPSSQRRNVLSLRPTIAPQTRWYYVPDTTPVAANAASSSKQQPTMSSCLELDGYLTSFDEEDSDDDDERNDGNNSEGDEANDGAKAVYGDDEDLMRRALAPFENNSDDEVGDGDNLEEDANDSVFREAAAMPVTNTKRRRRKRATPTAEQTSKEWRHYLQISQSHAAPDKTSASSSSTTSSSASTNATLAGYLLKRSSGDPHVWKRHYCVLTQDDFWYVPRVIRSDEFLLVHEEEEGSSETSSSNSNESVSGLPQQTRRTIEIAQSHGRISLADATLLLGPSTTSSLRADGLELVSRDGITHQFRACSAQNVSAGAATPSSIGVAKEWRRMLQTRIRDALENSLTKHAELLVTEETVARNDRWRSFLVGSGGGGDDESNAADETENQKALAFHRIGSSGHGSLDQRNESSISLFRSRVLYFGLDVAEYKEGCRQIQTLLWADMATPSSSSTATMSAIRKLVKELWSEASLLLDRAVQLNAPIVVGNGSSNSTTATHVPRRGLETLCHHVEYVITQKRRFPTSRSVSSKEPPPPPPHRKSSSSSSSSNNNKTERSLLDMASEGSDSGSKHSTTTTGEEYPHQRDPPPIDLFDLLWNELRTLG